MSPEEFDNRLKSSFQDEFLPPKDLLWQNISQRLDQNAKKPFWYWLVPVIIVISAGIAWLGNGLFKNSGGSTVQTTQGPVEQPAIADNDITDNQADINQNNQPSTYEPANLGDEEAQNNDAGNDGNASGKTGMQDGNTGNERSGKSTGGEETPRKKPVVKKSLAAQENAGETQSSGNRPSLIDQYGDLFRLPVASFPYFRHDYIFEKEEPVLAFGMPSKPGKTDGKNKKPNTPKQGYRSNFDNSKFESKWWFTFGGGPQISFNNASIEADSQAYIHKDLWANRSDLTRKGNGFHAQGLINYQAGRFIFETGLGYNLRTEDIRMNVTSYSIAFRDTFGRIELYRDSLEIIGWIKYPNGDSAKTRYYGVANFSSTVKNKYQVFTIPFNVKVQQPIGANSFITAGLGGGISYITGKNISHLNMVSEKEFVQNRTESGKKENRFHLLTGSANASVAFFTNFNDVGQIGFYTSYQMYLKPWQVIPNQYTIRMSDLQFGIMLRKPL